MSLFDFIGKNEESEDIKGEIGYYGLAGWWLSEFSGREREHIIKTFKPLGSDESYSIVKGEYTYVGSSPLSFLSSLAGWFRKKEEKTIAYRILDKAEGFIHSTKSIIDIHFYYQMIIETNYPERDNPKAFDKAVEACEKQIEIAPEVAKAFLKEYSGQTLPAHVGFEQLAIIREKEKNFDEAIKISKEAMRRGWNGDWENRIFRCNKKKARNN